MSPPRIRLAQARELERLADVELSAAERFREVGLGWVVEAGTLPAYVLRAALGRGTLWVAPDRGDRPAGFLAACELDGALFVIELSVALEHQGRGLGSALLDEAVAHAAREGMAGVTLTTFRDVPWNAPFYARRGFVELDPAALGPGLRARLAAELAAGHEPGRRCAMARPAAPESA
ncbi:GNAT family N-acetyltransferase [Geminicoccaceae bacterium 1502E]|nr:GNAT family N-acetyltransferase [Geminicoccaceae bacterium 1502E]